MKPFFAPRDVTAALVVPLLLAVFQLAEAQVVEAPAEQGPSASRKPDVVFVPTPQAVVDKMLELAEIKKGDIVYDLGCGDGRIVVTAAKKYGVKAVGFDIDPARVKDARANVKANGVEQLVTIKQADIFTLDLREATVVTLYLLPELNVRLMPQLAKLKPGSRIISHDFDMRGAKPTLVYDTHENGIVSDDDEEEYGEYYSTIYKWIVPWEKTYREVRWVFEDSPVGKVPEGWSMARTGSGLGSLWNIIEDESAPSRTHVLRQVSSEGPGPLFNLCVCDEAKCADVDLTVSLKAVRGKIDQGGGPVWRYKDENNYYIARVNPLENNFRLYKVEAGRRQQLDSANVEASAGQWHSIRIRHEGDHIRCHLNDKLLLDVHDSTFAEPGKVGLWTKADAVTSFDDFSYHLD